MTAFAHVLILCSIASSAAAAEPEFRLVYSGTEGGYAVVRTPQVLVTQAGTLLVFAQGRSGSHDQSDNDILVKRSTDGGRTWSKFQVIADQGKDALNSICVVQCQAQPDVRGRAGRILVIGCSFPAGYEQREFAYLSSGMQEYQRKQGREKNPAIRPGYEGKDISRNYVVCSDDDGQSWSPMRDVTAMVKLPAPAVSCVPGPGAAIQLTAGPHKGRIVAPCWARLFDKDREKPGYVTLPYAVFSDDGGQTWTRGELTPPGTTRTSQQADESHVVELPGGGLMLTARSAGRLVAVSPDGGQTWSPLQDEPALAGSPAAAGFVRYDPPDAGTGGRLLLSQPSETGRVDGVIFLSLDNGKTWPIKKTLRPGRFSYSCLARLPNGDMGCVFDGATQADEFGNSKAERGVLFARFSLDWLAGGETAMKQADAAPPPGGGIHPYYVIKPRPLAV